MKSTRIARWLLSLVAASSIAIAASTGDGASTGLSTADRKLLDELLGKGVVGKEVTDVAIEAPDKWFVLTASTETFKATAGDAKGHEVEVELAKTRDDKSGETWRWSLGNTKTLFFQQAPTGDITLTSNQDSKTGTITSFTPGALQVPVDMEPGDVKKAELDTKVYDFSHPDKLEHEGTLQQELTHLGSHAVTVPAGQFEAVILRSRMTGKVGPAKIDDTEYKILVQGKGTVALVEHKDIAAGVFYKEHDKAGFVLAK